MATVVQSMIEPDAEAIKAHLEVLFAPCAEHYPRGLIELRYGQEKPNQTAYFLANTAGITEASEFAANRSRQGCNVYVGVNPRKPETKGSAEDTDVAVAFWHFADLDSVDAVDHAGRRMRDLPPTFTVTTGTEPHRRPHLYWLLEEPVGNMQAWTERQRGIAQFFEGDAVINPSRIMRLAGTVNFPPQHKVARGYRMELTSLRTTFSDEHSPVTPEQISTAYPMREKAGNPDLLQTGQSTLSSMRRTQIGDLLNECRNGSAWHNAMIRLVAHMAAIGRTSAEILALADNITLPGYSVEQTRREMETALLGARSKWALPEPEDDVTSEEANREDADAIFPLFDLEELENMPPPTWLIHEMIAEEGLSVIYGDPGAGKSFIAIDMALRTSHAMDWHGKDAKATGVLYIAGEGVRGLGKRVKGWKRQHDMEGVDAPFLLVPVAVQLLDEKQRAKLIRTIRAAIQRAGFQIGLIVIDTVSRALAGSDENGQETMSAFVAACDEIRNEFNCAVLAVHHSGKDKEKGMRGSTVLLGGCDASIRVSKSEKIVTLKTEKQKDAEEAEPIYMEMRKVEWATGLEEPQSTLVPFRSEASSDQQNGEQINRDQIRKAFGIMADAWGNGRPLSHRPEAAASGRYAPKILSQRLGGDAEEWRKLVISWLETECLAVEIYNKGTKAKGLQVLEMVS